jgi:ABC-type branched-subunit amino acid transport system ATPase component
MKVRRQTHQEKLVTSVGPVLSKQDRLRPDVTGLRLVDLQVRFGGLVAVAASNLGAPVGQITALIGPNGAGKTTTFNACSGLRRPTSGQVFLDGQDVSRSSPSARARKGLGRTFQLMELYDSLDVRQNVALGREAALAGANPLRHVIASRAQRALVTERVEHALALCGIEGLADRSPGELSTGQRRLVELARAVAGDFRLLLLDEPSSGLDPTETEEFGLVLRSLVDTGRTGILLVEHDMSLVMKISDYCYVLDFGTLIFEGTPAEIAASAIVRAAYLGSEADGDAAADLSVDQVS